MQGTHAPIKLLGQDWLDQIFRAETVRKGGVVRRRLADVQREVGLQALELEVRRRGFRMIACGGHIVIFCCPDPIQVF